MKNQFSLHIYLSRIEHVLNLGETLKIIPKPAPDYLEVLDESLLTNQYTLSTLKDYMYKHFGLNYIDNIEGIYFGQETCENLIPSLKNLQQAVEFCQKNEYSFTFATPYVSLKGMERLKKLFEFLNSDVPDSEVLVNDFGVLHLLNTEYKNLKPILGRLLIKMKRDPRFSISGFDIANVDLPNLKKVEKNQGEALQASTLELPVFQEFLRSKGIERVAIDMLSQNLEPVTIKKWSFPVDFYWPWTYVTSSRSCAIAAYTQQGKEVHPTEEPCKFQCRKYEFTFRSDKKMFLTIFRGNAVWMCTRTLYEQYFKIAVGRLIYEPYIPV
jgi:hypothetical protein